MGALQGQEKQSQARMKRFMTIMDSMTDKELDSPDPKLFSYDPVPNTRVMRVARGSGSRVEQVLELLGKDSALAGCPDPPDRATGMSIFNVEGFDLRLQAAGGYVYWGLCSWSILQPCFPSRVCFRTYASGNMQSGRNHAYLG